MQDITFKERFQYWFDNIMSRGAVALIGWLGLLSAVLIVIIAGLVYVTGVAPRADNEEGPGVGQLVWKSLMHAMDAGTLGGDEGSIAYLGMMLVVTVGGIFLVSMLIGLLTTGIEARLEELRKGRSRVVEAEHTVILGWSNHVFTIVSELIEANKSRGRSCIAILADRDKVEMDDELSSRVPERNGTHIVCRTGNPVDSADIDIVNPQAARSVIILAPEGAKNRDTVVIKSLLALLNSPTRRQEAYHVVAEVSDSRNLDVARMVGKDELSVVLSRDVISRIAVQTCRQSGLSVVYTELMDFGGDEIYFKDEKGLVGKDFGSALFEYGTCTVMGVRNKSGDVMLNPGMDYKIEAGDQVIVIAEDDDKVVLSAGGATRVDASTIVEATPREPGRERTLILGWNSTVPVMVRELDQYVPRDSELLVVAHLPEAGEELTRLQASMENLGIAFRLGDTTDRELLDSLDPTSYEHVITVSYSEVMDPEDADAHTLITLLHLRDIGNKTGRDVQIVSEMLDPRNRDLAEATEADDFIVSDRLISLLMCQISENKDLFPVFMDLFRSEGSEIYLKPAADYVQPGKPVNFYTVTEAARRRGEIALGYRVMKDQRNASKAYGVKVNPSKSTSVTFAEDDMVVVLAEE